MQDTPTLPLTLPCFLIVLMSCLVINDWYSVSFLIKFLYIIAIRNSVAVQLFRLLFHRVWLKISWFFKVRDTQSVSLLPPSLICKGDDKKLRLFSRVSLGTLSFIFQGCETKCTSSPRLGEHPRCRVVVAAGDLGSSLKALCRRGFFQTRRVGWKLIESPSPKPTGQEGAGATLKLVFLYVKSNARFALDAALSVGIRFLVWLELKSTLTLVNKSRVNFDSRRYVFRDMKTAWMVISGLSCKFCVGMGVWWISFGPHCVYTDYYETVISKRK